MRGHDWRQVKLLAVTNRPGLKGSLVYEFYHRATMETFLLEWVHDTPDT